CGSFSGRISAKYSVKTRYNMSMKTVVTEGENGDFTMMRHGKNIKDMDRSFDIEFWQRQGDAAIFNAAWELVEFYLRSRGINESRLQRTVEHFQPTRS
ncbi:MAG: hypothetical protein AB7J13_10050, partial [Pyrinomonadaceae bacterium]